MVPQVRPLCPRHARLAVLMPPYRAGEGTSTTCRRIVALALVTTLGSLALAACGSQQTHTYTGYWQSTGGSTNGLVINISKNGGTYSVDGLGTPPMRATMQNGKLTVRPSLQLIKWGEPFATMTLTLSADGKTLTASMTFPWQPLMGSGPIVMTRPTVSDATLAAQVLKQDDKGKDAAVKEGLHSLQIGIQTWATDHNDRYPSADVAIRSNKGFAGYLDSWSVSPYSGAPMKSGDQPGDYTYTSDGTTYKLSGHLGDGSDYTVP